MKRIIRRRTEITIETREIRTIRTASSDSDAASGSELPAETRVLNVGESGESVTRKVAPLEDRTGGRPDD